MRFITFVIASLILSMNLHAKDAFIWYDDEDYKPFIYKDKDGEIKGIFKDIMTEVFKRMDIPLKYDVFPWKRTQMYVIDGKADGMITVPTKERLKIFYATDPIIISYDKIFVRKDNPRIKQIEKMTSVKEFKGYKVIDSVGSGWAKEHYKGLDVIWAPNQKSVLMMLANKRADIYIANEFIGISKIQELIKEKPQYAKNLKKLIVLPQHMNKLKFCLLIRKNSKFTDIIPTFNKILKQIKKDGTYDKILKKYLTIPKN